MNHESKLPQTGESNNSSIRNAGILTTLVSSILALFGFKKKNKN
ncbi:LPXTG-motif cell wall-anchored protein [Lactobacillus colini]|uniref:LPXTG-motif cell wall-anchored protein n=1 Tax=Lactobacillus colini TaxID=1819254 RepID=A0ABS4MC01_9LACO|nr:LPXTG cell wall anchor domain-containing protein [Lactobacillus colini]MBP2057217.1 LPXTG-motif cell wall-anchored protein [Lactobacillus colini]